MSRYVIYINLEKYLAEWAVTHFGNPIVLPAQSHGNAVIRTYIQKLPAGMLPEMPDGTKTAVAIPDSKSKPVAVYNYMGPTGKKAVREVLKDIFRRNLWADLSPIDDSCVCLSTRIGAWCEMHGIGLDRVDTVKKIYYRMRDSYNQNGINLRKKRLKKDGQADE